MDADTLRAIDRRLERLRERAERQRAQLDELRDGIESLRRRVIDLEGLDPKDVDREVQRIQEQVARLEDGLTGGRDPGRRPEVGAPPPSAFPPYLGRERRGGSERRSGDDRRKLPGGPL